MKGLGNALALWLCLLASSTSAARVGPLPASSSTGAAGFGAAAIGAAAIVAGLALVASATWWQRILKKSSKSSPAAPASLPGKLAAQQGPAAQPVVALTAGGRAGSSGADSDVVLSLEAGAGRPETPEPKCTPSPLLARRPPAGGSCGWEVASAAVSPRLGISAADAPTVEFGELLGAGTVGQVHTARWAGRGVAVKVMPHDGSALVVLQHEQLAALVALRHPNLVEVHHCVSYTRPGSSAIASSCSSMLRPSLDGSATSPGAHARERFADVDSAQQWSGVAVGAPKRASDSARMQLLRVSPPPSPLVGSAAADAGSLARSSTGSQREPPGSSLVLTPRGCSGDGAAVRAETWVVQEHCELGSLASVAAADCQLPDEQAEQHRVEREERLLLLLHDAAQGLKHLHSSGLVHGDLHARNVVVTRNGAASHGRVAKLCDFGAARVIKHSQAHRTVQSLANMPPELLRYGCGDSPLRTSPAADIYAFGVLMWEVYTGQAAFRKLRHEQQFFEAIVLQNLRPCIPAAMPADMRLLMERCWATDPSDRPTTDKLVECLRIMAAERRWRRMPCGQPAPTSAARGHDDSAKTAPLPRASFDSAPITQQRATRSFVVAASPPSGTSPPGRTPSQTRGGGLAVAGAGLGLLHQSSCPAAAFAEALRAAGGELPSSSCSESSSSAGDGLADFALGLDEGDEEGALLEDQDSGDGGYEAPPLLCRTASITRPGASGPSARGHQLAQALDLLAPPPVELDEITECWVI